MAHMEDDFDSVESVAALKAAEQRFQSSATASSAPTRNSHTPLRQGAARQAALATSSSNNGAAQPKVVQPTPQALPPRISHSAILVSQRQKGNPILTHISALPWEYADIPADYVLGATTCALFLSLKYHRLHPEYIYTRLRALAGRYQLRVLLCMVDIDNHEEPLCELAKTSMVNDLTLMLAWSAREAARYLELYRSLERADPTAIRGARSATFAEHMNDFITTPRGVNRTDAVSLVSSFGSVRNAVNADRDLITAIPGWGEKKVDRFLAAVNEPFRIGKAKARRSEAFEDEPPRLSMLKASEVSMMTENSSRGTPFEDDQAKKRGREDSRTWEPADDEQEALFIVENNSTDTLEEGRNITKASGSSGRQARNEPQLSDSVQAALAKLRNQ